MLQQDIYEILCNTLDVRSGTVQSKNEEIFDKSSMLFQVWWKGNIAFLLKVGNISGGFL